MYTCIWSKKLPPVVKFKLCRQWWEHVDVSVCESVCACVAGWCSVRHYVCVRHCFGKYMLNNNKYYFPIVLLRWLKSEIKIGDISFIMSLCLLFPLIFARWRHYPFSNSTLHHQEMQHNQFRIFYTLKHKVMIMKACRLWWSHSL